MREMRFVRFFSYAATTRMDLAPWQCMPWKPDRYCLSKHVV